MSAPRKAAGHVARRSKSSKRMPYIGGQTFNAIGEQETGTNEEHVHLTLNELPSLRMAVAMLNKDDKELAAILREADEETVTHFTKFADGTEKIADRHRAVVELCSAARIRIMIAIDRCLRGPNPAPWAVESRKSQSRGK